MTQQESLELVENVPFILSRINDNILEVSPKLSKKKLKELKDKTATVRVYIFDDEDAERLMNTEVVDLDKKKDISYLSNIVKSLTNKLHFIGAS